MPMDNDVKAIIHQLGVSVLFGSLECSGYYSSEFNVIFISNQLDELQTKVVLLHELGHASKQRDEMELYKATMAMKIKLEYGANRFMIKWLLNRYISITGDDPQSINYLEFMRQNDIPARDENIVKETIASY